MTYKNFHEIKCGISSVFPEMEWGHKEKKQKTNQENPQYLV